MIAQSWPLPEDITPARSGPRAAREAVRRRRSVRRRARYVLLARIVASVSAATLVIGVYLALMANVTRLNYELSKSVRTEARLSDESTRLDDEIERLAARERLAGIAKHMGLRESTSFAQVSLPAERRDSATGGLAFLPWLK